MNIFTSFEKKKKKLWGKYTVKLRFLTEKNQEFM